MSIKRFVIGEGWVPKKLDVSIDAPQEIDVSFLCLYIFYLFLSILFFSISRWRSLFFLFAFLSSFLDSSEISNLKGHGRQPGEKEFPQDDKVCSSPPPLLLLPSLLLTFANQGTSTISRTNSRRGDRASTL